MHPATNRDGGRPATATILGLAVKELAGHLPPIGTLNLTPDLLTPLLARLGSFPAPQEAA